jgi:anti-sigma factor ChrR (cupin superfamily)
MTSPSNAHGEAHSDLVCMYALQTLPASEIPVAEAQIAACAHCRQELDTLRPVVDAFASWPIDVLRPSASLWDRLAQRVSADGPVPVPRSVERWVEPEWREVAPGISVRMLTSDAERDLVTMLVRLRPGTEYPPHTHARTEELYLLDGELWIDERKLYPGDYSRAEPDTVDRRVWSETGCTCLLITSPSDSLR